MKYAIFSILLIAVVLGITIFSQQKTDKEMAVDGLEMAPVFELQNYTGETIALADFAGKNIILNTWAVWCPFCVEELKDFAKIQEELGDSVKVIVINRAESLEVQKGYTDDLGLSDKLIFLLDPEDSFYRSIGGFSMPETIFVNGKGEIVFHKRGPMKLEEMREKSKELFNI